MIIFATGVQPRTEFLDKVVNLDKDYVKVDAYMNTTDPKIYAAGDVCSYPYIKTGERINHGHWVTAQQQGAIAALNMLEEQVKLLINNNLIENII